MIKISKTNSWFKNLLANGMSEDQIRVIGKRWRQISRETDVDNMSEIFEIDIASLISGKSFTYAYDNCVVKGSSDGHIDCIHYTNNSWYFIQTKMTKYSQEYIRKMITTYNEYFSKINVKETEDNRSLAEFKKIFLESKNSKTKINFIFVGMEDNKCDAAKQAFKSCNYNIEAYSYSELFKMMASQQIERDDSEFVIHVPKMNKRTNVNEVQFNGVIGVVKAEELISQFIDLNDIEVDNIFNKNIRNKVVKPQFKKLFKDTIDNHPDYFHLFNNGITMVAERLDDTHDYGRVKIVNPQIINGQQTFRTLLEIYRDDYDFKNILIPIKIIKEENPEMINMIARFSNNQTAVKESELKYTTPKYTEITQMAKSLGYKLEGKKGKRDSDDIVSILSDGGAVAINEIIRSHASINYPQEYMGKSKSSISSVVNVWFADDLKMASLLKRSNFLDCLNAITSYKVHFEKEKDRLTNKYKKQGMYAKEYGKLVRRELNPYKYGVSLFYYLHRKMPNIDLDKTLKFVYKEDANKNMNWYKSDEKIWLSVQKIKANKDALKAKS